MLVASRAFDFTLCVYNLSDSRDSLTNTVFENSFRLYNIDNNLWGTDEQMLFVEIPKVVFTLRYDTSIPTLEFFIRN